MADERFKNIDWANVRKLIREGKPSTSRFDIRNQAKTQSEFWLEVSKNLEVKMNGPIGLSLNGEVLFTRGFNGCTALLVRAVHNDGLTTGALKHRHTDSRYNGADAEDIRSLVTDEDTRLFGTILFPQDRYGRSLRGVEQITDDLERKLLSQYKDQWDGFRKVGYAIYEGFPGGVNSGRLVYNVQAGVWHLREQSTDRFGEERPYSGLMYKTPG